MRSETGGGLMISDSMRGLDDEIHTENHVYKILREDEEFRIIDVSLEPGR